MAPANSTPTSLDGVTSLYRRFRPGRFCELRGQDHIVRALQGAVRNDRISHAYLFSGPRGTGKTTTARILAKALNCEQPVDGDACNTCASCVAITRGSSLDVIELDAASNNGVDDIREITAGAWHGTPGRWKVYIFDEVHQLSKSASAALLKTLEEPPQHVIFVLATTDPHKVLPTIRSRTQHLEFRLLAGETLSTLLHDVQGAAGLTADDATIDAAVRLGRGSARDALSALDQLIATGALSETQPSFDGLFGALSDNDAVAALRALAVLSGEGWDPEQLSESFAAELRQAFLLQVAPDVADAVDADRARLTDWGSRLGLARPVRALETIGRTMREMKSAPEKIVLLEVALVRLVTPDLDSTYQALDERLTRLEHSSQSAPPPPPPPPKLQPVGASAKQSPPASDPLPTPEVTEATPVSDHAPSTPVGSITIDDLRTRFNEHVVGRTPRSAQMVLKHSRVLQLDRNRLTIAVPSEAMRQSASSATPSLIAALEHEFKVKMQVEWTVDGSLDVVTEPPAARPVRAPRTTTVGSDVEPAAASDDTVLVVDSVANHLINEMFPGAEEVS